MTHSALASRYASALVDVATSPKSGVDPHQLLGELRGFEEVLAASAELRAALTSPSVPPARKRAVVGAIGAKLGISRIARNFLFVLTDHRRLAMLTEVLEAFDLLSDERLEMCIRDRTLSIRIPALPRRHRWNLCCLVLRRR